MVGGLKLPELFYCDNPALAGTEVCLSVEALNDDARRTAIIYKRVVKNCTVTGRSVGLVSPLDGVVFDWEISLALEARSDPITADQAIRRLETYAAQRKPEYVRAVFQRYVSRLAQRILKLELAAARTVLTETQARRDQDEQRLHAVVIQRTAVQEKLNRQLSAARDYFARFGQLRRQLLEFRVSSKLTSPRRCLECAIFTEVSGAFRAKIVKLEKCPEDEIAATQRDITKFLSSLVERKKWSGSDMWSLCGSCFDAIVDKRASAYSRDTENTLERLIHEERALSERLKMATRAEGAALAKVERILLATRSRLRDTGDVRLCASEVV
jgi:hypothetical protein